MIPKRLTNILLILLTVLCVVCFALTVPWIIPRWEAYVQIVEIHGTEYAKYDLYYALLGTFISFCTLASAVISIILLILSNLRLFRRSTWTNLSDEWAQNKAERAAAKQAKAEADKQKRINDLQRELDELHGSDKGD